MTYIWVQFGVCVATITIAGTMLSNYGNVVAKKTGMGGTVVGLVLLATVTSVPELITGISSVMVTDLPDLAIGAILGSCVFNLAILVALDAAYRSGSIYQKAHAAHGLSAGFGIILIGITGLSILGSNVGMLPTIGPIGLYSPVIVVAYLAAMRTLFQYERTRLADHDEEPREQFSDITLRQALARYAIAAFVVIAAGIWLPTVGDDIATNMGWHHSFVGTLLIAFATSAPELVVAFAALRLAALNMAIGNVLGSNLFNVAIIPILDIFYLRGDILSSVSVVHSISAFSAMTMSAIFIVSLLWRANTRVLNTIGRPSLILLSLYLLNSYVIYVYA